MTAAPDTTAAGTGTAALVEYALGLGDDALILAQRLLAWIARAPQLEEDVAIANLALDLLGQARALLRYAGQVEGGVEGRVDGGVDRPARDEDDLAYLRDQHEFRNVHLVEAPNGDFAVTMARQLAFSAYQYELYQALQDSHDDTLAAIAAKAVKEVAYHRDHAEQWVLRLGDGTPLSHQRMQAGLEQVWPYTDELFETDPAARALPGVAVDPATLRPAWDRYLDGVLAAATLHRPEPGWHSRGGRSGRHSEHLGHLLAQLQHLHRSHPGASW